MKPLLAAIIASLARRMGLHVYLYPKADSTATVVVLFDFGKSALVIRRGKEPFKGRLAFPGGFLNIGEETLLQAAKRELEEETKVEFSEADFVPVDERSEPGRDPRGHVVDHGYVVVVGDEIKQQVVRMIQHSDDADDARIVSVSELMAMRLAFDHNQLLISALEKAGFR